MGLNRVGQVLAASLVSVAAARGELPPGFVQGDVVSYSYVPNRRWTINEGYGILPYLCEYRLQQSKGDDRPLETSHTENVGHIDRVSQWSTAVMLYPRVYSWRDELINLMIRAFSKRQLIILSDYWRPGEENPFRNTVAILDELWAHRDSVLTDPEGDQATGRQIINNILTVKTGDEGECTLRTSGLQTIFSTFESVVQNRVMDGEQPFRHIQVWYNLLHYGVGCHAASQYDVDYYGRFLLPSNTEFIGADTYHFWNGSDPLDMTSAQRRTIADAWQDVTTRYYPGGLWVSGCGFWAPECRNDTHALINGCPAAGANGASLFFIANSCTPPDYHTTPIETMDAFYDAVKAGPWVGLSWYAYHSSEGWESTRAYLDKTLEHFTGPAYTQSQLNDFHDRFIASRTRMFNDVVYQQFCRLNPPEIAEVTPGCDTAVTGREYVRPLQLVHPATGLTWSVEAGPAGLQVDGDGRVHGWTPTCSQMNQTFALTVRVEICPDCADEETWLVQVWAAADFNHDGDVDQGDFGHLQACLTGNGRPYSADCGDADLDDDGDVDPIDCARFALYLAGANVPPGCPE